jgi:hypothetical protein
MICSGIVIIGPPFSLIDGKIDQLAPLFPGAVVHRDQQQFGQPGGIVDVGLAARHILTCAAFASTNSNSPSAERESNFNFTKRGPIRCGLAAALERDAA